MSSIPAFIGVDRDMCQSAATCLAFRMYELDDEVKAVLLTKNSKNSDDPDNPQRDNDGFVRIEDLAGTEDYSTDELQNAVLESAKICPFNAIIVRDGDGNQLWPPL